MLNLIRSCGPIGGVQHISLAQLVKHVGRLSTFNSLAWQLQKQSLTEATADLFDVDANQRCSILLTCARIEGATTARIVMQLSINYDYVSTSDEGHTLNNREYHPKSSTS